MKKSHVRIVSATHISFIPFILLSIIMIGIFIPSSNARQEPVNGFQYQGDHTPQEGMVEYQFNNNLRFGLESSGNVTFDVSFENSLRNRYIGMRIMNQNPINLQVKAQKQFAHIPQGEMGYYQNRKDDKPGNSPASESSIILTSESEKHAIGYSYESYYLITLGDNYDSIDLYSPIHTEWGLGESDLCWALYDTSAQEWYLLESTLSNETLTTTINKEEIIGNQLILTVVYLQDGTSTFWSSPLGIGLIIGMVIIAVFGLMMSKTEYREYLLNRFMHIDTGAHRLSMEQVLENEYRSLIINEIIDYPGIHFNELLRRTDITAGTLAWHLDILETFKVIRKQRVGQYLLYYPYLDKNPISKIDPKLQKSRTTLEILQLIDDHPGMYQNQIAKRMDLDHKTIKYHLDKLLEAEIVYIQKKGRQTMFFPKDIAHEVLDDDLTYPKDEKN